VRLAPLAVAVAEAFNCYSQSEILNQLSYNLTFKILLCAVEHENRFNFICGYCGNVIDVPVNIFFFLLVTVNTLL